MTNTDLHPADAAKGEANVGANLEKASPSPSTSAKAPAITGGPIVTPTPKPEVKETKRPARKASRKPELHLEASPWAVFTALCADIISTFSVIDWTVSRDAFVRLLEPGKISATALDQMRDEVMDGKLDTSRYQKFRHPPEKWIREDKKHSRWTLLVQASPTHCDWSKLYPDDAIGTCSPRELLTLKVPAYVENLRIVTGHGHSAKETKAFIGVAELCMPFDIESVDIGNIRKGPAAAPSASQVRHAQAIMKRAAEVDAINSKPL